MESDLTRKIWKVNIQGHTDISWDGFISRGYQVDAMVVVFRGRSVFSHAASFNRGHWLI